MAENSLLEDTICVLAEKYFPGRVEVVFERNPRAGYIMMAEKRGKRSVLHVNLAWQRDLIEMLDRSYIEAIVEHEAAHVKAKVPRCLGVSISAPMGVMLKYGVLVHRKVSDVLNEALSDAVNDAFAAAFMSTENAKRYFFWRHTKTLRSFLKAKERECSAESRRCIRYMPRSWRRSQKSLTRLCPNRTETSSAESLEEFPTHRFLSC